MYSWITHYLPKIHFVNQFASRSASNTICYTFNKPIRERSAEFVYECLAPMELIYFYFSNQIFREVYCGNDVLTSVKQQATSEDVTCMIELNSLYYQ